LLSNRQLAHRGYSALENVLASESPEIIEAHWEWASRGRLYDLPTFRARYLPAFEGGTKLWIRRDIAKKIESNGRGRLVPADTAELREALQVHRYADHDIPDDRTAFVRPGVVLVLRQANPVTADRSAR
jgi:hypothetical protein